MNFNRISFSKYSVALCFVAGFFFSTYASAVQNAAPFTYAKRYNDVGQITGTISPDPDGRSKFPATRSTYDQQRGVLVKIEEGALVTWQNENTKPSDWTGFNIIRIQKLTYDDLGRKATVEVQDVSNNAKTLTQYAYDDYNRVQCVAIRMNPARYGSLPDACTPGAEGDFGPDRITRYTYNDIGQVTKETRGVGTSLVQDYVINTYNSIGQLTNVVDANGNRTILEYYDSGKLHNMFFPSKVVPCVYNAANLAAYGTSCFASSFDYEQYGYDLNGNRTSLRKRDGYYITYKYDALNRETEKHTPVASRDVYTDYDLLGLKVSARFGSTTGSGSTNTFNGFGELKIETTNVNGTSYTSNYIYDADSNRTYITYPDGVTFKYNYDRLDRLTTITDNNTNGSGTLITNHYDDYARPDTQKTAGNAVTTLNYDTISRLDDLKYQFSSTSYNLILDFSYNPANQMLGKIDNNTTYRYTQKGSKAGNYSVNGLNEYTSVGSKTYTYDDNGNLNSDGNTTYVYDVENRLIKAIGSRNDVLSYDPSGRLYQLSNNANSIVTYFLYNGDSLIAEYQNGAMTKRYLFGGGVDKPLVSYNNASVASSNRLFLHSNHQGSIIAASNTSGTGIYINTYDAYGNPGTNNQGRFAYTGQTYLSELGMYYYRARIYNPGIGRFLQTDPIGYEDNMNLYAYTGNDPLNKRDPSGKCETGKSGASVGVCPKDAAAAKLVDAAMKDKNSQVSKVDKQAMKDGKEIKVNTGSVDANGKQVNGGAAVDDGNGVESEVTMDLNDEVEVFGVNTETGQNESHIETPLEILEHEVVGHGVDHIYSVDRHGDPEPNAIQKENEYRKKAGIPFERIGHKGIVRPKQ